MMSTVAETASSTYAAPLTSYYLTPEREPGVASTVMPALENPRHDREAGGRTSTLDTTRIDDVRISAVRPLITPALLQERVPVDANTLAVIESSRNAIASVLHGTDRRLIVVVGPCSIHDYDQAVEYASRLKSVADRLCDHLLIVMRTYFEKPRTALGWKGYINDPHLDGSFAINEGLELARRLLLEVTRLGMPTGTEFLDLLSPQYVADLIAWGAIGARTTESPSHRQLASGLSSPIGFKNGTDGSVKVAADAILAARSPHAFMGMTKMGVAAIFETRGNDDCHVILRGGRAPNYKAADRRCVLDIAFGRPARTGKGRLFAWQQRQRSATPDRRVRRSSGPGCSR